VQAYHTQYQVAVQMLINLIQRKLQANQSMIIELPQLNKVKNNLHYSAKGILFILFAIAGIKI
jgi:hypothetical protein